MRPFNRRHQLIGKISLLALMMALFGGFIPAQAGLTVPLMVDYLDTGGFGASSLSGVAFISTTGNFAVLDDQGGVEGRSQVLKLPMIEEINLPNLRIYLIPQQFSHSAEQHC
jgi:hypothetical protein